MSAVAEALFFVEPNSAFAVFAVYLGVAALLYVALTFYVVTQRVKAKTTMVAAPDSYLFRVIRVHGNTAEQMPLFFGLLVVAIGLGLPVWAVHATALSFIIARLFFALAIFRSGGPTLMRAGSMLVTLILQILLAGTVIFMALN